MTVKIVRKPNRAEGGITPEERALMNEHCKLWISRSLRTAPVDHSEIKSAIVDLYAAAGLAAPRVVVVPSPLIMAFAYGASAAIWYERRHSSGPATRAATDAAARSFIYDVTRAAIHAATNAATDAAVAAARAATYAAARDAIDAATNAAEFSVLSICFAPSRMMALTPDPVAKLLLLLRCDGVSALNSGEQHMSNLRLCGGVYSHVAFVLLFLLTQKRIDFARDPKCLWMQCRRVV